MTSAVNGNFCPFFFSSFRDVSVCLGFDNLLFLVLPRCLDSSAPATASGVLAVGVFRGKYRPVFFRLQRRHRFMTKIAVKLLTRFCRLRHVIDSS